MSEATDAIVDRVRQSSHSKVKVAVCDIDGVLRGKYLHKAKFLSAVEKGFGFCDVVLGWDCADACYDNVTQTGWHTGYPDAPVRLDLDSFREVPWDDNVPFVLGHFVDPADNVTGHQLCPRSTLRRAVAKATKMGFTTLFGVEFEWFNFAETPHSLAEKRFTAPSPMTPGMFGYSLLRASYRQDYFSALFDWMSDFDVPIEGLHTETGPGVYEVAIRASRAVEAADRAVLFKAGAKEIAYRHNVIASFMARWSTDLPGCSGHIHQSLWDSHGDHNLFFDADDPHTMSQTFKHYLAGQLHCLPEILPMFAPTINSYKRLVEGYWAPTRVTWGVDNRTVAARVIPGKSPRLESRVPGADINPYLAVAAALASGLYGIEHQLALSEPPVQGNGYAQQDATRLAPTLYDAATRMRESEVARALFGDAFVDHFTATRIWEWRECQKAVTDWELRRYFEII